MLRLRPLICLLLALLLSACADEASLGNNPWPPGPTTNLMPGGFSNPSSEQRQAIQKLNTAGVQVIQLGEIVQIVFPADRLFEPTETTLKHSAIPLLDQAMIILRGSCKAQIHAIGHTDIVGTNQQQITFSKLQAQAVVTYLWTRGIPLNHLSFMGVGMHDDDATFRSAFGNGYNRRVELMFWRTGNNSSGC